MSIKWYCERCGKEIESDGGVIIIDRKRYAHEVYMIAEEEFQKMHQEFMKINKPDAPFLWTAGEIVIRTIGRLSVKIANTKER